MLPKAEEFKRIHTQTLQTMKQQGEKIAMLTAYDYSLAKIVDAAGIEIILVGDSAANVMAGHTSTLPITLDQMIYHGACVVRAVQRALVVVDLPFGSYQGDEKLALHSAVRVMKETGASAVKLEGGSEIAQSIQKMVAAGIPVMGHLGLTPQSIHQLGTYSVRAQAAAEAEKLLEDALLLEKMGCFAIVLEKIPADLAQKVTSQLRIPVIGIGAGANVDGQVLVLHDMLGINKDFKPKFLRKYLSLWQSIEEALQQYRQDVKSKKFPSQEESY